MIDAVTGQRDDNVLRTEAAATTRFRVCVCVKGASSSCAGLEEPRRGFVTLSAKSTLSLKLQAFVALALVRQSYNQLSVPHEPSFDLSDDTFIQLWRNDRSA